MTWAELLPHIIWTCSLAVIILGAAKHHGDRVVDAILAAEAREVQRDRAAGRQAGVVAMDALGRSANR